MCQRLSIEAVWNPSAKNGLSNFISCEAGAPTPIPRSCPDWLHGSNESQYGSGLVRGTGNHFQRRTGTELRLSRPSLVPAESWKRNQHAVSGIRFASHTTLGVRYIVALRQTYIMQEKFVLKSHDLDYTSWFASPQDRSHHPGPPPAMMSPDDDDNDTHFGFRRASDWKLHERGNAGSRYEDRHSCIVESREEGKSRVCLAPTRANKEPLVNSSTVAIWRAAILRICVHHTHLQTAWTCSDLAELNLSGNSQVIGKAPRTSQLLCV